MAGIAQSILILLFVLLGYGPPPDNSFYLTHCSTENLEVSFDDPDRPEVGAFSRSYLKPPELQYGCWGTSNKQEDRYADQLAKWSVSQITS
jgi:hypothetical protein